MIEFKKVTFQNLLGFGNTPTTIFFDRAETTLITGNSGAGKSTIVESLVFGLFGKPFRKIKKDSLCPLCLCGLFNLSSRNG